MRALAAALVFALPLAAAAQDIAVAEPTAATKNVTVDDAKRLGAVFSAALENTGMKPVPAYGKGAKPTEFVTSISVSRKAGEVKVVAQVTRLRLDRWAARAEASAPAGDEAAVARAVEQVANEIAASVRTAPSRVSGVPAPPKRGVKAEPEKDSAEAPDEAGELIVDQKD